MQKQFQYKDLEYVSNILSIAPSPGTCKYQLLNKSQLLYNFSGLLLKKKKVLKTVLQNNNAAPTDSHATNSKFHT